jgi:hypothetical protein
MLRGTVSFEDLNRYLLESLKGNFRRYSLSSGIIIYHRIGGEPIIKTQLIGEYPYYHELKIDCLDSGISYTYETKYDNINNKLICNLIKEETPGLEVN